METQIVMVGEGFQMDATGEAAFDVIKANRKISEGMEERLEAQKRLCEMLISQGRERIKVNDKVTGESYTVYLEEVLAHTVIRIRKDASPSPEKVE